MFLRWTAGFAASVGCAGLVAMLYDLETVLAGLSIGLFVWPSVILLLTLERFAVSRRITNLAYLASLVPVTALAVWAVVEDRSREVSEGAAGWAMFILTCYLGGALGAGAVLWILPRKTATAVPPSERLEA
jgi:hypothetical protein